MKIIILLISALGAQAQGIIGLPASSGALTGVRERVKGESVVWWQDAPWIATSAAGEKVTLSPRPNPGPVFRCVALTSRGGWTVERNGTRYVIEPNTNGRLVLAEIPATELTWAAMTNRLGTPTSTLQSADGSISFIYSKSRTARRLGSEVFDSTINGKVGGERIRATATTRSYYSESLTTYPYYFGVHFTRDGKCFGITDMRPPGLQWVRDPVPLGVPRR